MQDLTLIKLGGSVVTFKEKPLSANHDAISQICYSIAKIKGPIVLVHGGGSFGHYWSVEYDMHTAPRDYNSIGISKVHDSMLRLNGIIVTKLIDSGLRPYSLQPSVFTAGQKPLSSKIKAIAEIAKKLIPITFGDVIHAGGKKYSIISGDAIMTILARALKPKKAIFATNVDGILKHEKSREVVAEIRIGKEKNFDIFRPSGADVTGGMQRKIREATSIAVTGVDVHIVNGLYPERIEAAAKGGTVLGTIVTARRRK